MLVLLSLKGYAFKQHFTINDRFDFWYETSSPQNEVYFSHLIYEGTAMFFPTSIDIPENVTYNGVAYKVVGMNRGGYLGDMWSKYSEKIKKITLPKTLKFLDEGFKNCSSLAEIEIPANVVTINAPIFQGCSSLKKISVNSENIYFTSIDGILYNQNKTKLYVVPPAFKGNLIIPESVIEIADYALAECQELSICKLPTNLEKIGNRSFLDCKNLETIVFSNSIKNVGLSAFKGCLGLKKVITASISGWCQIEFADEDANPASMCHGLYADEKLLDHLEIPEHVMRIGDYAFRDCRIKKLIIPSSVRSIGKKAFENCKELESVEIESVGSWCGIGFQKGENPLCYAHNLYHKGELLEKIDIPNIPSVKTYSFEGCTCLKAVTIPHSNNIGHGAFKDCLNLEYVLVGGYQTQMENDIFEGCKKLSQFVNFSNCTPLIPQKCNILAPQSYIGFYKEGNPREIALEKATQTTYTITSIVQDKNSDFFLLDSASLWGAKQMTPTTLPIMNIVRTLQAENYAVTIDHLDTDTTYMITVYGKAFGKDISGSMLIKTKPMELSIQKVKATNVTLILKGVYKGDADVVRTDFGEYGTGDELRLTDLYPGGGYQITFNVTTSDGKVASVQEWVETIPIKPSLEVMTTSTSAILNGSYSVIDATIANTRIDNTNGDKKEVFGLDPGKKYTATYYIDIEEGGTVSTWCDYNTPAISFETQAAEAISDHKARITAKTNGSDDEQRFGFEWRRYDAPEEMPSSSAACPYYNGFISGSLSNLSKETYYKYRPYYRSDSGVMYYGNWVAFITADAYVYFEPEVHTYDVRDITDRSALVRGLVVSGSDEITEQGFEFWPSAINARTFFTRSSGTTIIKATGTVLQAILEGLDPDSEYSVRTFVETSGKMVYGETFQFRTQRGATSIEAIQEDERDLHIVGYYNLRGNRQKQPQIGLSIVRLSDGTSKKIFIRK